MSGGIENKVAKSGLVTIDLGEFAPRQSLMVFDMKDWLYQGLILRENDFKEAVKEHEWSKYEGALCTVYCSNDAIIPVWAFMIVASKMSPYAEKVYFGSRDEALNQVFKDNLDQGIDPEQYRDGKIVIKGCGDITIPSGAFVQLTNKLQPYVKTIMYGEPCSTVPVYKQPRAKRSTSPNKSTENQT